MACGRQEAEWQRFANLMACIHNRTRFSEKSPPAKPNDYDIFYLAKKRKESRGNAKERMATFFALHNDIPVQRMKLVDGQWVEEK